MIDERMFTLTCHCGTESPSYSNSEQVERWWVAHYQLEHPEKLDDLVNRLVHGKIHRMHDGVLIKPPA